MKNINLVQLGIDIPRWKIISGKKYFFVEACSTKKEADRAVKEIRKDGEFGETYKHKTPFLFLDGSNKIPLNYSVWGTWNK